MVNNYGMYSPEGNNEIHSIVLRAKQNNYTWAQTYEELVQLADSNHDSYGEALDTVVREYVYDSIGADKRGECFYI
jgi:hypothetical protein